MGKSTSIRQREKKLRDEESEMTTCILGHEPFEEDIHTMVKHYLQVPCKIQLQMKFDPEQNFMELSAMFARKDQSLVKSPDQQMSIRYCNAIENISRNYYLQAVKDGKECRHFNVGEYRKVKVD